MEDIFSIRWHSRAGQGAVTAANFVAEALAKLGFQAQSFPDYGAEKRGAPVFVFNRFSKETSKLHDPAHILAPDMVILVDPTLVGAENTYEDILENLKPHGTLFINTSLSEPTGFNEKFSGAIYHLDATKIAMETIGKNIPNVTMVGGLSRILDLEAQAIKPILSEHLSHYFPSKIVHKNLESFTHGYEQVQKIA